MTIEWTFVKVNIFMEMKSGETAEVYGARRLLDLITAGAEVKGYEVIKNEDMGDNLALILRLKEKKSGKREEKER